MIDIQGELEAATASAADALSNQKIPKNVEKHVRDYYDQLNKGKSTKRIRPGYPERDGPDGEGHSGGNLEPSESPAWVRSLNTRMTSSPTSPTR